MELIGHIFLVIYLICFALIIAYACIQITIFYAYKRRRFDDSKNPLEHYPYVTIQLPVYNEKYVIERLIRQVSKIKYPQDKLQIQVIDDSDDDTVHIIDDVIRDIKQSGKSIEVFRRKKRSGFKAGALKDAMTEAKGEFIAIFDADFLPDEDFLLQTIPEFKSAETGVVQTRWEHINENYSLLTRMQAFHLNVHFIIEQTGRAADNVFLQFNGTAGVWRKKCIEDAGGWSFDTLTEDLDLSYRAQMKKWKIKYLPQVGSPAELPADMGSFKNQQFRWMKGGAQTARKILPNLLSSAFSLKEKTHATAHLLNSSIFLVTLVAALSSIIVYFSGAVDLFHKYWLFAFPFGYIILFIIYYEANYCHIVPSKKRECQPARASIPEFLWQFPMFLILSMGMSVHNSRAVILGFAGKKSDFIRTPKFNLGKEYGNRSIKRYLEKKLPSSTILEIILGILFIYLTVDGIKSYKPEFVVFHAMMGIGLLSIGLYSLIHYIQR